MASSKVAAWGLVAALAACTTASAGCNLSRPNWLNPGPEPYQQWRAQEYDPYPEVDNGPEVVGARPRDYQAPASEPKRVQKDRWTHPFGAFRY